MTQRLSVLFQKLVRHRRTVLVVTAIVAGVAAIGATRTRVDYGVEHFFLPAGPEREAFDRYRKSFPQEDTRITLFWEPRGTPSLRMYRDMERAARVFEEMGLKNVRWLGTARVAVSQPLGDDSALSLLPLIALESSTDSSIARALTRHRRDPLLQGFLWDTAQTVFAIHGDIAPELNRDPERRLLEEDLTSRLGSLELSDAQIILGGLPVSRSRAPKLLAQDLQFLALVAFLLSGLVLLYFLRNAIQVLLMLASVVPAYLCTIGLMGFLGKPITVLTSFIGIIVLVVGMSDSVHLVVEFRHRLTAGGTVRKAVRETFATFAIPCFYTCLTTAIGFGGLMTTRIGIVVDFGAFTSLAILLTYVFSMTLLPVALSFSSRRVFDDRGLSAPWLRWLVASAVRGARGTSIATVALFVLVAGAALSLGLKLRVNTLLIDDIRDDTAIMRDIRWIERHGFGLFQLAVHLKQTGAQPLHHPDALRWMQEFRTFTRQEPVVQQTMALPDLLVPLRRSLMGTSPDDHGLPASVQQAAQLVLIAEMDDPELVRSVYLEQQGEAQVIVTVRDTGSIAMTPFLERVDQYLLAHPVPDGQAVKTGTVVMINSFTAQLLRNLGPSVIGDIVLISLVLIWLFRSVRVGLFAVIPNVFPLLVLMGALQIGGFDLKPSTILVFSIAYALAVDNTVHLLSRFLAVVRSAPARSPESALEDTLRAAGPSVVMTSLVVTAGFAVLTLSQFQVLFLIGLMTVVSGVAELAGDLYLLPHLLRLAAKRTRVFHHAVIPVEEVS